MKSKTVLKAFVMVACLAAATPAMALDLTKAISGAVKVTQAVTLTDEQMAEYVKEYIDWMDKNNKVCDAKSPYTVRLNKLVKGFGSAEGIPLNFKVYQVKDVNACKANAEAVESPPTTLPSLL